MNLSFQILLAGLMPWSEFNPVPHFTPFKNHRYNPYLSEPPSTLEASSLQTWGNQRGR